MRFVGFIGPSYTLQSVNVDCQRCINLYPEMDELGTGNESEVASLVSTPGLRLLSTLPTGPVRGTFTDSTGQLWVVGGNILYQIDSLFNATAIGTLNTDTGPVSFSDNGIQGVLVDGPYGYSWTLGQVSTVSIATSGVVTALTHLSQTQQIFSGSQSQAVSLPDVTTLQVDQYFIVQNVSSSVITVQTFDGVLLQAMDPSSTLVVTCTAITGSGLVPWSWVYSVTPIAGSTFFQITDPNFLGANQVTFMDGYFIFNKPGSEQFYLSPLNSLLPFNALDIGSAEANPDNIVGLIAVQESLYLFGTETVEVFYDSGDATFPFDRIQGAVMEIGCAAAFSVVKIQNSVVWLGQDQNGRGIVYQASGFQPERISTFAIENEIAQLGDVSSARAWTYQQAGHSFYCLNLPGAMTTWVFDISNGLWHERASLAAGLYQRHLADCHAFAYDIHVVGDYSNGNIYALDQTVFTDNENPIVRERAAPHISKDLNLIFHRSFQLDMEMGLGLSGTQQGTNPQAILQWSNDYGNTWSNEHWAGVGLIGSRKNRTIWRRLGSARDRVYRVRIADPIKVTMLGAEIDIEEGSA